jgi:hypothetical protein
MPAGGGGTTKKSPWSAAIAEVAGGDAPTVSSAEGFDVGRSSGAALHAAMMALCCGERMSKGFPASMPIIANFALG